MELGVIGKKKKVPRRVIHFASGETMEEYSTDEEEDEQEKKDLLPPVDPVSILIRFYLLVYWIATCVFSFSFMSVNVCFMSVMSDMYVKCHKFDMVYKRLS